MFIVLVVAAALTIYLLSPVRRQNRRTLPLLAENSAAAEETPRLNERARFLRRAGGEVLLTHLLTAEAFSAEPAKDGDRAWILSVGESPTVEARFSDTVERGAVAGFELAFVLPASASKNRTATSTSNINANSRDRRRMSGAIQTLLTDLIPASDADDAIPETTVRLWAEKAPRSSGGRFVHRQAGGGSFGAYVTQTFDGLTIVCTLDAPD